MFAFRPVASNSHNAAGFKSLRHKAIYAAPHISIEIKNPACAGQRDFVRGEWFFKRKPVYSRRERREKYCRHTRGSAEVSDRTSNAEEKGFGKKNGEGGIRPA